MSTCIRVVIVDDHLLFLEALRALLHSDDDSTIAGLQVGNSSFVIDAFKAVAAAWL